MKKLVTLCLVGMLCLFGCSNEKEKTPTEKEDNKNVCGITCDNADMSEYDTFKEEDHVFLDVSMEEALRLVKDENFTGIMYFGYPNCPWCKEAVPIMNEVAKDQDTSIYYINKKSEANVANPEWEKEMTTYLDKAYGLDKNEETKEPVLYVPEVIVVKEGAILDHHMGTVEGHDASKREMNKDEIKLLESIYRKMFAKIQ